MKLEKDFQGKVLIPEIKRRLPGCIVLKNDPDYIQGIPDLTVFYEDKWAMLEVKKSAKAKHRPNQDIWVEKASSMSFAEFIYPENKDQVLDRMVAHMHADRIQELAA